MKSFTVILSFLIVTVPFSVHFLFPVPVPFSVPKLKLFNLKIIMQCNSFVTATGFLILKGMEMENGTIMVIKTGIETFVYETERGKVWERKNNSKHFFKLNIM